ncbi:TPA: diguanylate cyclase, partial [Legionella pneumophila]|nr:diguanylate cyclase [Legionella pneumophila]HAU2226968.1 GGDEF domain-containing protein [Legionella pneumophila]HCX3337835.1 GGDEF domain-containing protein [Legionella pneumophila]HCX3387977.1 GGDEF domain-containing protein [Legionella pneumophila]HCX3407818.1 GGDEF domain-containing protein [Legionella pneumophila]
LGQYINIFALFIFPVMIATWKLGIIFGLLYSFIAGLLGFIIDITLKPDINLMFFLTTGISRIAALSLLAFFNWKIERINQVLIQTTLTDSLTGISNRHAFFIDGNMELERTRRSNQPLSMVFLDLDNFKSLNDTRGHECGDEVLILVTKLIRSHLRKIDIFARLGGDEFVMILPFTDNYGAKKLIDSLHHLLKLEFSRKKIPIGFSIGVAFFPQSPESLNYALKCADNLMYEIKKTTKNDVLIRNFPPK